MLDLKAIEDKLAQNKKLDKKTLQEMVNEIKYFQNTAKGCCCSNGIVQDILNTPTTEANPFPQFGGVTCSKCKGLNVLVKLNIRQRQTILDLYKELEQVREEREKVAALLTKQCTKEK